MNAPEKNTTEETPTASFELIKLAELHPSPTNPRKHFPEDKLQELAKTIKDHGVIEPIVVRPWPFASQSVSKEWDNPDVNYEIVSGERRFRASRLAGAETIPALIRHLTDDQVLEIQVIENLQREEVHPIEEAEGYQLLMDRTHCSADELAAKVGKSKAYIYARLKLTALCDTARDAFREGKLTASTALLIARIPGKKLQTEALEAITDPGYSDEPLSYREAQREIQENYMLRLGNAPFPMDWEALPKIKTCAGCQFRSGNQPELFADIESADVCTDPSCFARKRETWAELKRVEAEQQGFELITGKAAEKIIPHYADGPRGGYVAIDDRCEEADPVRPVPEEPKEPECQEETDECNALWTAYNEAEDAYEDARIAAFPTYRELLEGEDIKRFMVQHPKTGDLIECVKRDEAEVRLIAIGKIPQPMLSKMDSASSAPRATSNNDHQKKVQAALDETAYRATLLKQILFKHAGEPLTEADMRTIARSMWEDTRYDHQELLCKVFNDTDTSEDILAMGKAIDTASMDDINRLLLALPVIHQVQVRYWDDINAKPELLLATAERFGIDAAEVRTQLEAANAPKKTKAKPATKAKTKAKTAKGEA